MKQLFHDRNRKLKEHWPVIIPFPANDLAYPNHFFGIIEYRILVPVCEPYQATGEHRKHNYRDSPVDPGSPAGKGFKAFLAHNWLIRKQFCFSRILARPRPGSARPASRRLLWALFSTGEQIATGIVGQTRGDLRKELFFVGAPTLFLAARDCAVTEAADRVRSPSGPSALVALNLQACHKRRPARRSGPTKPTLLNSALPARPCQPDSTCLIENRAYAFLKLTRYI